MKYFAPISILSLTLATVGNAVGASSSEALTKRADFCDQYGTVEQGSYTVYNNAWGQQYDQGGKQCTGVDSLNGNTIAWHTSWSWGGASTQVKSYANVGLKFTAKQLSAVSGIKSSWKWSYSNTDVVADVAYDMFLSSTADGSEEYEIMVWLAALGNAGPISSTGSPIGSVTINGIPFKVWRGPNGKMTVYSFVAESTVNSFSGDMLEYFTYLIKNQGLSSSLYLIDVQAGTEPFTGKADMKTSAFSVEVV
ncbi:hypothetical protein N7449_006466 [Penicillium cf. viridicatum]|uniref:xyloglucan-specific endo-beta-1,4-glucanase n=1 Tax=Penicillium cf. viridicatum TaxID=2972119 RepID=A0A9W9JHC6_9EURO|nr:hypothetical protein N7449_006466 [Penicillium cf. viridicatum]